MLKKSRIKNIWKKKNFDGAVSPLEGISFPAVSFKQEKEKIKKTFKRKSPKAIKKAVSKQPRYAPKVLEVKNEEELEPEIQDKAEEEEEEEQFIPKKSSPKKTKSPRNWTPLAELTPKSRKKRLDLMKKLNIMTCTDIKMYLETTEMTEEEKIIFIKQNITDGKTLRSYIQKQHFNLKDLNYMADAGSTILNTMGNETYEIYQMFTASNQFDETDEDCVFLNEMVKQYEKKQQQNQQKGYFQQAWDTMKTGASKLYSTVKPGIEFAYQFFDSKAFQLWTWISTNPKSAYLTLVILKTLKTNLCRTVGKNLGIFGSFSGMKTQLVGLIKKYRPDVTVNTNSSITWLMEVSKPYINEIIGSSIVDSFNSIWNNSKKLFISSLTVLVSTIPYVGQVLAVSFSMVIETILDNTKDKLNIIQEQLVYQKNVENAFSKLFEIVNPFDCVDRVLEEAFLAGSTSPTSPEKTQIRRYLRGGRSSSPKLSPDYIQTRKYLR
jgi:hypothetical protein